MIDEASFRRTTGIIVAHYYYLRSTALFTLLFLQSFYMPSINITLMRICMETSYIAACHRSAFC